MLLRREQVSIAPMMNYTDRHFRYIMRLMTRSTRLYTEMIPADALINGSPERFLTYNDIEHPLALQIGGSDPNKLAQCSTIASEFGYDEINLNVGCPSDRVRDGRFGACLMANPSLVADCLAAMQEVTSIPVTVKHRIGIDDLNKYEDLCRFLETVKQHSLCRTFIVHARIAVLGGLSPKENRRIPPLRYDDVYRLTKEYPDCHITINGGIRTLTSISAHLQHVDEVMLGRIAYDNPFLFSRIDTLCANMTGHTTDQEQHLRTSDQLTRHDVIDGTLDYMDTEICRLTTAITKDGSASKSVVKPAHILRHLLGLFAGQRGTKQWKQLIQTANFHEHPSQFIRDNLPKLPQESLFGIFETSEAIPLEQHSND